MPTCALCGRVGARGFRDSHGAVVCSAGRSCLRRYRAASRRDAEAAAKQDGLVLALGLAPLMSVGDFAMPVTLDYAIETLNDRFDLDADDDHPVVRAMATAMDDAWLDTADDWQREHAEWLRSIPTYPRECWCGQWPPLGTSCHYHGRCTCIEWSKSWYGQDGRWMIRKPGRVYGFDDAVRITLPGDCPVHPGDEVPPTQANYLADQLDPIAKVRWPSRRGRPQHATPVQVGR